METIKKFIKRFEIENCKIEYSKTLERGMKTISLKEALEDKKSNIYFLPGVRNDMPSNKRAGNSDITHTNRIVIDLDIRNDRGSQGIIIADEEIKLLGRQLGDKMKNDKYFGQFSYITFSGNGLHIHFIGDTLEVGKDIDKDLYSIGIRYIYKKFEELYGEKVDYNCSNIARIIRLPGTINQKNGVQSEILVEQNIKSELVKFIPLFAKKDKERLDKIAQERKKEIEEQMKKYGESDDLYNMINKEIKAYEIAELLIPDFKFDNRKNFYNKKGGYTAYFYSEDMNAIVNGGSRYFAWGNETSGWSNFSMVKHFYNLTDRETFEYFKKILK